MSVKKNSIFDVSAEDKKMLNSIFWRSFTVFAGDNGGARSGASGFIVSEMPALKRYYKDNKEGFIDALQRHDIWYNITQNVGTFAMGLVAAMEKENSEKPDFDSSSIAAIKTSLMGPMSGIGDAIFWGVVRCVAAGIALGMVGSGSILAPIMFLVIYNVPSVITRYCMTYLGFSLGSNFLEEAYTSGLMKIITKAASTLGLMMVGGMTATTVGFETSLAIKLGAEAEPIMIQSYLNDVFVGILPLCITLLCLKLLNKGMNVNVLMLGILIFSILCAFIGIV